MHNLINYSKNFNILNCNIEHLIITNSDLGNLSIFGCIIGRITLYNSSISEIIINGVIIKKSELGNKYDNNIIDSYILKDNYRQLKFVMDKNANYTEANRFFAKEMEYYGKVLNWKNNFFDKFLYTFQGIVSNFGNSWIRAFSSLILLSCIAICFDLLYSTYFGRHNFGDSYVQYFNPIFILPTEIGNLKITYNWIEQLGFIIFKTLYAVILYQLIVAAKRTTKR